MMNSAIAENYQSGFGSYSGMANIESKINFSMQYNPLEMQLSQLQPLAEPEDPPETLHTPWGIWLHWRDPLHKIHQRFDAAHVVRTGMAAEDILHYAHYVPIIEGPEHERVRSYEMNFAYDYSNELEIYNLKIDAKEEKSEDIEIMDNPLNTKSEEDTTGLEAESNEPEESLEESEKLNIPNEEISKNNPNLEIEKQLTMIFKKFLMSGKIDG